MDGLGVQTKISSFATPVVSSRQPFLGPSTFPFQNVYFSSIENHKIVFDENNPIEVVDDLTGYTIYLLWAGTWNV